MEVSKAIKERREITSFKNNTIAKELLEEVLEAGYYAPTGNNLPSREFILVTDRKVLDQLEQTTPFMKWLKDAPAAIVITGRPTISKYWIQDASISSGFIWLKATDLGLGIGFGAVYHHEDQEESIRRESWVKGTLDINKDRRVIAILGIGYPNEKPKPKTLPNREDIIFYLE